VAVIAPSGPPDAAGLRRGLETLEAWGYRPEVLLPGPAQDYLAAPDEARLAALEEALVAPRFAAVWAARGGYGLHRILDRIPWTRLAQARQRWVLGFSDLTALIVPLAWRCPEWVVLHAPNVQTLPALPGPEQDALRALLAGAPQRAVGLASWQPGEAEGPLLAGNLCLLSALAGAPQLPTARGCVLALEDVGERPYRLDRMLSQLRLAGWLEGLAGLVLGEFRGCDEGPLLAQATLRAWCAQFLPEVPVAAGLPMGHGGHNRGWRERGWAQLDARAGVLEVGSPRPLGSRA